MINIGERIGELRKRAGYTQKELAEKLNVTVQMVSKWETGATAPDVYMVSEIADAFGVSTDAVIGHGTESGYGAEKVYESDADCLDLPMAVLVNADSISAAEFFAAALQEYGKATVVGTQTIGKGYSQRTYPLSDGSALRLSDQAYYTPKDKSLIGTGVTPDVTVELSDEKTARFYFLSDEEDDQLAAARAVLEEMSLSN